MFFFFSFPLFHYIHLHDTTWLDRTRDRKENRKKRVKFGEESPEAERRVMCMCMRTAPIGPQETTTSLRKQRTRNVLHALGILAWPLTFPTAQLYWSLEEAPFQLTPAGAEEGEERVRDATARPCCDQDPTRVSHFMIMRSAQTMTALWVLC